MHRVAGQRVGMYSPVHISPRRSQVTMVTVGYGDYSPRSDVGRILTGVTMCIGVCFTAMCASTANLPAKRLPRAQPHSSSAAAF